MAKLLPQMQGLAGEVTAGLPATIFVGGTASTAAVPSLAAAQRMATVTVPSTRAAVGARFEKVAETIEVARDRFASQESLVRAFNAVPTLAPLPLV